MISRYIGIDFDGTMVTHKYPAIGEPLDFAIETVIKLQEAGHKIILYTMRSGERLEQAVEYMEENLIDLYGINENKSQKHWTDSPKIFANLYIDDAALGTPMDFEDEDGNKLPRGQVDWVGVEELLIERGFLDGVLQ